MDCPVGGAVLEVKGGRTGDVSLREGSARASFQSSIPGINLSFDEGGVASGLRFNPVRQYNKDKPQKVTVDFFVLCNLVNSSSFIVMSTRERMQRALISYQRSIAYPQHKKSFLIPSSRATLGMKIMMSIDCSWTIDILVHPCSFCCMRSLILCVQGQYVSIDWYGLKNL